MKTVLDSGSMDRRLTIKTRTVTTDAMNTPVEVFTTLATIWASREDVSDGERVRSQQVGAEITSRFVVRYSTLTSGITPLDRVVCDDREFEVVAVKEIGRRVGIEITGSARADQNNLYT